MSRRLPPGPHGLSPELVERNQRERLIAATAEVCGEHGYAESSVAEIAKRAGVSTASFYRQFADKRECMLASFEELFGRLLAAVREACSDVAGGGDGGVRSGVQTAAGLLGEDLPTARLLSVEILAMGRDGVLAQHRAVEEVAGLLRGSGDASARAGDPAWAAAAAMVALIATRSAQGEPPAADALETLALMPGAIEKPR